jgi:hypothetical protein
MGLFTTLYMNETQHYSYECSNAESRIFYCYAECHSAERLYTGCRGAHQIPCLPIFLNFKDSILVVIFLQLQLLLTYWYFCTFSKHKYCKIYRGPMQQLVAKTVS